MTCTTCEELKRACVEAAPDEWVQAERDYWQHVCTEHLHISPQPVALTLPHKAYEEMYGLLDEFGKINQPTEAQIEALEQALAKYERQGVMA